MARTSIFTRNLHTSPVAGLWSDVHRVDFWNDSVEFYHRLWMGTFRLVTPRDRQLFSSKTIHFHRIYVTDRDKQGGRAKFSPAALPTGLLTGLSRQLRILQVYQYNLNDLGVEYVAHCS